MAKDKFLAGAFTDLNGNHKYNAGKDALIAGLVDTNGDKTVSVGDTIQFGTYPLHLDGTDGRGTFTQTSEMITGVVTNSVNTVDVITATGRVIFTDNLDITGAGTITEQFRTFVNAGNPALSFIDIISEPTGGSASDSMFVGIDFGEDVPPHLGGPGGPDTLVNPSADFQSTDQPFLDVFIA